MKQCYIFLLFLFSVICASGQNAPRRVVTWRTFGNDSVNIPLNSKYQLIEDSCAFIIRYGRYNGRARKFLGPFTDVSKANPSIILSSGNYSAIGLKDGEFINRSPDGVLLAKGNFKANKLDGAWQINYPDGKPRLTFEAVSGAVKIIDAWDAKGLKTVANGKGDFEADLSGIVWKGALINGKPDGKWKAIQTDSHFEVNVLSTETFADGIFKKGETKMGKYTDETHIALVGAGLLPFIAAESMQMSYESCSGVDSYLLRTTHAQYSLGSQAFTDEFGRAISNYLKGVNLAPYNAELVIEGIINEKGAIINILSKSVFNEEITTGIIRQMRILPLLKPAMANGKPIKEKILFTIAFNAGSYRYGWRVAAL